MSKEIEFPHELEIMDMSQADKLGFEQDILIYGMGVVRMTPGQYLEHVPYKELIKTIKESK